MMAWIDQFIGRLFKQGHSPPGEGITCPSELWREICAAEWGTTDAALLVQSVTFLAAGLILIRLIERRLSP